MDFFQAQEFFAKMYPGKTIGYEFDDTCHRTIELVHTDGLPNLIHHVECNKVKVNVEGMEPIYCPIQAHRFNTTWMAAKAYINAKSDVYFNPEDIENLKKLQSEDKSGYDSKIKELCEYTGLSVEQIESEMQSLKDDNLYHIMIWAPVFFLLGVLSISSSRVPICHARKKRATMSNRLCGSLERATMRLHLDVDGMIELWRFRLPLSLLGIHSQSIFS